MFELQQPPDYYGQFMKPLQDQQRIDITRQAVGAQQMQAQTDAIKLAQGMAQLRAYQRDASSVISNPSPEGYRALMLKYPEMHDSLKNAWDSYGEGQRQRDTEAASKVYAALSSGRTDLALQLVKDRKTALAGTGADTKTEDALIDMIESGDPAKIKQAQGMAGFALASAIGPDKIGPTLEALSNYSGTGDSSKVVGRAIGHYENGKFVVDYRDPDAPQYRELDVIGPDGQPHKAIVAVGGGGTSGGTPSAGGASGGFDNAVGFVLKHEGGYNPSDMNGAPVNFGINQKANPGVDVKGLTEDSAKGIYKSKYWDESGAENLPPQMQTPYFDTYIINPARAKQFLKASGGDVNKFMDLRETWMNSVAAKNPKYKKAYANRNADLRELIADGGTAAPGQPNVVAMGASTADAEGGALDPATISFYAQQVLAGAPMPALGMGKSAAAARQQIMKEVARQAGTEGLSGSDQAVQMAHYKSATQALKTLETQAGTIEQNEQTALANGQQFLDRSKELPAQTNIPLANSVTQFALRHTGDPTIAAMDAAWNTFTTEYAKVVSGSPSGAGVLSDSARHEAQDTMRGNYSYAQKVAAFNQMKADMANRMAAIRSTIADKYDQLTKHPRSAEQIAAQTDLRNLSAGKGSSGLPKGAKVIGTYHGKRVIQLANGKRMVEQ